MILFILEYVFACDPFFKGVGSMAIVLQLFYLEYSYPVYLSASKSYLGTFNNLSIPCAVFLNNPNFLGPPFPRWPLNGEVK